MSGDDEIRETKFKQKWKDEMKLKERWRNWKQGNEIQNKCLLPDLRESDEIEKSMSSLS